MQFIDVSHNNGSIDWAKVSKSVDSAFIKATEGQTYIDPMFIRNAQQAAAMGLKVGYYHFATLNSNDVVKDATAEAKFFLSVISSVPNPTLPLVLDIEKNVGNVKPDDVLAWISAFINVLNDAGYGLPLLYSYTWFLQSALPKNHGLGFLKLWLADYNAPYQVPSGWEKPYLWQYDNKGNVEGIRTNVDLNKYV